MVNDKPAQVVTFYVPESDSQIAAWYAWWIDEETGHLVNETMVSRLHYMRWRYFDFDQPVAYPAARIGSHSSGIARGNTGCRHARSRPEQSAHAGDPIPVAASGSIAGHWR